MRSISIACLIAIALIVGACAGRTASPATQADVPIETVPMPAPTQDAPPAGVAPGERVIKTIVLPKGQTPYDMPEEMPPAGTVPEQPTAVTEVRVLKTVCLPKGQTPYGPELPQLD